MAVTVSGVVLWASALLATDAQVPASRIESFEADLPPGIVTEDGKVAVSDEDCQDGLHALRWDFTPGGKLVLPTGPLGNINVWTGYGGYSRSAFEMRIRTIEAPGRLTCRFIAGDQTGGSFTVPLVFDGWQRVCYHLSWRSRLENRQQKALVQTDRFVVEAPDEGKGGSIYLDLVCFNRPIDFRGKREAIRERWQPFAPRTAPAVADLLGPPTEGELAALRCFLEQDRALYPSGPATDADVARLEQAARDKYLLKRLANGKVRGRGLSKWQPLTSQMLAAARHWLHTDDPALRQRLEELFFLENDFLRQQGGVAQGAIQGLSWYGGRNHADACYIMREPLRRTGRLATVSDCLRYNYGYRDIFKTGRGVESMDYYYTAARYLFKIALMQGRPEDIVLHLRAFSRRLSRQLVDTIKPDGSCYHHGFHYFAYAGGATRAMASQMRLMAPTPFRVTREAYGKVKLAFMNMRWYANVRDLPLTLHGRHPGRQSLSHHGFQLLAGAGRPYHDGKLDPEVARACLRLAPGVKEKEPFVGTELEPEPAPTGHLTMPYAGLTSHRRGEWLAMVRGYGKYLAAQESYSNANRRGLFFGNGYLDILAGGQPVNILDSGCRANEGWDWRRLDGTTVIYMPYAEMANGHGTMSERSRETFVGGLTHRKRNGLFVMTLNSDLQYRKALPEGEKPVKGHAFRGKKTYFFFDGRIVCLGSDIENHDSPFPVQTNLLQKFLTSPQQPIRMDGEEVKELPLSLVLDPDRAHTFLDTQRTGYYVPAGQSLHLARQHQKSRDGHDKKDTEGDYATVWLDHGANPQGASYGYVVMPNTTPEALAIFAEAVADEKTAPYRILQRDGKAHIVLDQASRTWGCVFFAEQEPASAMGLPAKRVWQPCLLMAQQTDRGSWQMSLADPDLNLGKDGINQSRTVRILLRGEWRLVDAPGNTMLEPAGDGDSLLTAECREGRSYDFGLVAL